MALARGADSDAALERERAANRESPQHPPLFEAGRVIIPRDRATSHFLKWKTRAWLGDGLQTMRDEQT